MGCCSSKTDRSSSLAKPLNLEHNQNLPTQSEIELKKPDLVNIENQEEEEGEKYSSSSSSKQGAEEGNGGVVSCTKEEVDAILIQCGRLSRNSSADSGHDFGKEIVELNLDDEGRRRRQSSGGSQLRRTRERDPLNQKSVRRVTMSPVRRFNSPIARTSNGGKLVSTPLTDLDVNSLPFQKRSKEIDEQALFKHPVSVVVSETKQLNVDANNAKGSVQVTHIRTSIKDGEGDDLSPINYCKVSESNPQMSAEQLKEEGNNREELKTDGYDALVTSDTLELPPTLTRTGSSRRSRDTDVNVEAVADLNSCNSSNMPEVNNAGDDLMEPGLHKYVTVRKRESSQGGDCDELESSGSNSFVAGSQNRWISYSSTWEPNSAESSDCWTSSRSREDGVLPVSFPRLAVCEAACGDHEDSRKNV